MIGTDRDASKRDHQSVGTPSASEMRAFEQLFEDNVDSLVRYATSRVGRDDAEDLVADAFHAAALLARAGRVDELTPAWLMAVVRNKVIDRWRQRENRRRRLRLLPPIPESVDGLDELDRTSIERRDVARALGRISERHRTLLILHHADGLSVSELVRQSGATEHAIESALARARQSFRRVYRREDS